MGFVATAAPVPGRVDRPPAALGSPVEREETFTMKRLFVQAFFLCCALSSCGGGGGAGVPIVISEKVHFIVTGTPCNGYVNWKIDGTNHELAVTFPWSLDVDASAGQTANLFACDLCTTTCPTPPCEATLTVQIMWKNQFVSNNTTTGMTSAPACTPSLSLGSLLP